MASKNGSVKPDLMTVCGTVLAVGGILGGLLLEKGNIKDIAQYTAALIVLGGTFGSVLVTTPAETLKKAVGQIKTVFFASSRSTAVLIDEIIVFATKARKQGIISLESDAAMITDPFLKKAVNLAVDGTDLEDLKSMMELEIEVSEHESENAAKVFDNAGGYSPTIGIIGAVLGLIQVMKNLANIEQVGHGIAVAFVATVYGVAAANIIFLPMAGKIRARAAQDRQIRELIVHGVVGIIEGANPKLIRSKLNAYLHKAAPEDASRQTAATPRAA